MWVLLVHFMPRNPTSAILCKWGNGYIFTSSAFDKIKKWIWRFRIHVEMKRTNGWVQCGVVLGRYDQRINLLIPCLFPDGKPLRGKHRLFEFVNERTTGSSSCSKKTDHILKTGYINLKCKILAVLMVICPFPPFWQMLLIKETVEDLVKSPYSVAHR